MIAKILNRRNEVGAGQCVGTIDETEPFSAGLVELSEQTFPPPHGEAYVMFARQRKPDPDYTTKEITLSFTKGLPNDTYSLSADSHEIRVTFADNSDPANPVIYTQRSGTAVIVFDPNAGTLFGRLEKVILENRDDDVARELKLDATFQAKGDIVTLRTNRSVAA